VNRLAQLLWDRFLLSLPLALMGFLALLSYWMVRTAPEPVRAVQAAASEQGPDYRMQDFAVARFDAQGRLVALVKGKEARHFAQGAWTEMDAISLHMVDGEGRVSTASAKLGRSNGDATEIQLLGQAQWLRSAAPRIEFAGEFLHITSKPERISSHLPVQLGYGGNTFYAGQLDYVNATQVLQLDGRVRASLQSQHMPAP